ncbi:MAG: helix-turn-helix transcriptional regulator [Chitinophagaceae bacterium]|nr:helix-turn-helix transcriptional regulator [Chitinophagaceae bacterium]
MELTLSNGNPLKFEPGLPSDYSGPILCGASSFQAKSNLAELVIQELHGEYYTIRFLIGKFLKKINARGWIHSNGLYSYFMLKNGTRKRINTIGNLHIRQDQYACFFTESSDCSAVFEKTNEFRALDVFYSPKLLEELLPYFPELKNVMLSSSGIILPGKPCWSLPSMKEIINQILNCPYDEATRQFYFDLKVRELLYQLLETTFKKNPSQQYFTPFEIARIHEARDILESYISKKPPSLRTLSRKVALNEYKLKTGFKQYFNTSIFDWLIDRKMQYAKHLILTTNRPIKDICAMVGYPRTTNFITAFRRRFGMTPGSLRR